MGRHPAGAATHGQATCDQGFLQGNHPWPSPLQGRPSRKGQPPTARAATSKRNRPWPWLPPIGLTPTEASLASMMPARSLGGPRPQHCHLRRGDDDDRKSKGTDQQGGCASTASRCSGWKATIAAAAWGGEIAAADHWEAMMVALRHWRSWSLQWQQRKEAEQMSHKENTSGGKGKEQEGQQHHSDEEIITMVCWKATISGGVVAAIKRRGGNHVEQRKNGGLREHRVLRSWLHGQQCLLRLLRKGSRGFAATLLVAEEATVAGLSS
ncbi:hypothetical protein BHE74_00011310 [Ensete ventricosum]|nr:hypothetical protein BHE74_00011310 [Ensete ventricosum]